MLISDDSIPDDSQISSAIDYDLILKNIAELNVIAGEGIAQIKRMSGGAQFQVSLSTSQAVTH